MLYAPKAPRTSLISDILTFFAADHQASMESDTEINDSIEGTVAFHFCFSINQDPRLMDIFMKVIKKDHGLICSSFTIVCLLLLSKNYHYQEQIMNILKTSLMNDAQMQHRLEHSPWLKDYVELRPNTWETVLVTTIEQVACGIDRAIMPLVQFLTETLDQCCSIGGNTRTTNANDSLSSLAYQLTYMLVRLFKKCEAARHTILDSIIEHLLARLPSANFYVELLGQIVQQAGATLIEHTQKLKELTSLMSMLSSSAAYSIFNALAPLLVSSHALRDDLVITLRKYLFSRDANGRENALHALTVLISLDLTPAFMSTDSIQIYQSDLTNLIGRCIQSRGVLQAKAFTSMSKLIQKQVDCTLKLVDSVLQQADSVFEFNTEPSAILRKWQFDKTYQDTSTNNDGYHTGSNGNNSDTISTTRDPLPCLLLLLSCISEVLSTKESSHANAERCQEILVNTVNYLSNTVVTDYRLAKNLDYTASLDETQRVIYIRRLLALYESAIVVALHNFKKAESVELIRNLIAKHCQACTLLRDKSSKGCGCTLYSTCLTSTSVHKLCKQLIQRSDTSLSFSYRVHLLRMLVATAMDHAQQTFNHADIDIIIMKSVAQMLLRELEECAQNERRFSAGSPDVIVCVNGLKGLLASIMNKGQETITQWVDLFKDIDSTTAILTPEQVIVNLLTRLQTIINALFERGVCMQKEIATIMDLYEFIRCQVYPVDSTYALDWKQKIISNYGIDDMQLAKSLVNALLRTEAGQDTLTRHVTIASDVKLVYGNIGTIHEEPESQMEITFSVVNDRTGLTVFRTILESIDASIEELNYCLNHWSKPQFSSLLGKEISPIESRTYVLQRAHAICEVCIIAQQTYIVGSMAERLIQTLQRLYKLLGGITRKTQTLGIRPNQAMRELIKIAGGSLSQHLYQFITYVQQHDGAQMAVNDVHERDKRKKDKHKPLAKKARIARESRTIPTLIFTVEQFEKHVIALSKQSKIDFVCLLRRSTARDFRIQIQRIIVDEEEQESETEEPNEEDQDE
ncbi:FANCI solenoid 4-domain-containing protein [Syncephalis plumigaleata]|nr:FANCI solenoid 4-domain-containing protein [Syncephalis plumigaleata]